MSPAHPIIIVTGANGGVGYGICQRLVTNFCSGMPEDALPQTGATPGQAKACEYIPTTGLTLVMACRNPKRAADSRDNLLSYLDEYIEKQRNRKGVSVEQMKEFRRNLVIDLLPLDLTCLKKTFEFCDLIIERYPYVSHMILNAGAAPISHLNWPLAVYRFLTNPIRAVTFPDFDVHRVGLISDDGLGWTFQCNVFGHFVLVRYLEESLHRSPWTARVIWTSSYVAKPPEDWEDWQSIKAAASYEITKYQAAAVSHILDMEPESRRVGPGRSAIRNLISHPSITSTSIYQNGLNFVTMWLMMLAMYLARLLGSIYHPVSWINGAIAASHLSLVPLNLVGSREDIWMYGATANRWGIAKVYRSEIPAWNENELNAKRFVERCDELYLQVKRQYKEKASNGSQNGHAA